MLSRLWIAFLISLSGILTIAWLVALMHEKDIRPVRDMVGFFKKQSKTGRVVFGIMFLAFWLIASVKPGNGEEGGNGGGGDGGTNNVQMVVGPGGGLGNVANVEVLPITSTNAQLEGTAQLGNGNIGTGNISTMATLVITSTNTTRTITADDFRRGFVMTRVGTDEAFDFAAPSNAVVCADWRAFGAATDWIYVALTNWAFQVATNDVDRLRIYAFGKVEPQIMEAGGEIATNYWFAPFMASLGIARQANWDWLAESDRPSQLWHYVTPSNTLQITWQNALLDRDTDTPLSFQIEFRTDGQFTYRYDLSRLNVDAITNVLAGASFAGNDWMTNAIPTNVTSMTFYPLSAEDVADHDRDGDGVSLIDELFAFGTDPDFWDTDGDGVSDGAEVAAGTNPHVRDQGDAVLTGGTASPGFLSECGAAANRIVAWEIVPSAFSFARPPGFTNIVTRTFRVDRASPWQQLYVSARANGAAGWDSSDVSIRYAVDGGPATNGVPAASADSWRLPLGPGPVTNVTFIVEAIGDVPALSRPLHLLRWSPHVVLDADGAGRFLDVPEGKSPIFLASRRAESGWYVVPFTSSFAGVPHMGGVDADAAAELAFPPCAGLAVTNAPERAFLASDPVWAELPPEGTNAPVRVCCWEFAYETPGAIGSGPRTSRFDSPYPLSTTALRRAFHRAKGVSAGPDSPVTVRILPCHPRVGLYVGGAPAPRLRGTLYPTNDIPGEVAVFPSGSATPGFDGTPDPADTFTVSADMPDEGPEESPSEDDGGCGDHAPEKDDCDCADDEDGTSQCSFRLRISLGSPTPGENAGFLWTSLEEPTAISPAVFNVLGTAAVSSTTNALGEFTVTCSAPGGRTVQVADIEHGAAITVWNASGRFENRWEVTNPDGDPAYVRCRKLTVSGNALSDETFNLDDGMHGLNGVPDGSRVADTYPDECATHWDGIRGVFTIKSKWRTDQDEPDFVTDVHDETELDDGTSIFSAMSEFVKVGAGSTARRRLARRYGHDEQGRFSEEMDYWCDSANPYRHARLRSVRSNRRAWSFHDYDAQGRETVRLEQLDGSPFPGGLAEVSHLAELPQYCSARATVTSYEPQEGDSSDRNDAFLPRRRETWVMRAGKAPVLVGAETWLYTRTAGTDGLARRTCVHASGVGETLRIETTVAYPDDYAVPKALRGRMVSHTESDGVTETCQIEAGAWNAGTHAFTPDAGGNFLRTTTRRMRNGNECETYDVAVEDALRRLTVFKATCLTSNDTVIAFEVSAYDDIDRLRSTTYHDGTSLTNAYSCCRLLWKRDRQNRTTLRSAQTGTDHLYNAYEEIWLTNLTGNAAILAATGTTGILPVGTGPTGTTGVPPVEGYRVTQHFYDALGRETNTVVCIGSEPGAAVSQFHNSILPQFHTSTIYPSGGSSYSIRTDERGKETRTWESHYAEYTQVDEEIHTNGVYLSRAITTTMRNGSVTVSRGWHNPDGFYAWTEERRFTEYAPNGCRIDYVVTTSSDHYDPTFGYVAVTNSISTYDILGRLVTVVTPTGITGVSPVGSGTTGTTGVPPVAGWLVISNAYDGATSRILTTTRYAPTLEPRTTTYLYNDWGEQVGTVLDGITNHTDVTYEQFSNEWWKVETSSVIGSSTNSLTITRTQLTGLSDACRRHTITLTGNAAILAATGTTGVSPVDESLVTYDPSTGIEIETITSSTGPTVIRRSLHGVLLSTETSGETTYNSYDAFARLTLTGRAAVSAASTGTTGVSPVASYSYSPAGDLLATHTYTNNTDCTTETYAYDMLGNRIATTDALGNTTYRTYDPLGNLTAEWGATYPVRYTYDTQGRRTSLTTFRTTGAVALVATDGDTTTWTYDPYSGNCLSKTYADGSTIIYTYTPDNLLLRTTYASGKWKENVYDAQRRLCGVVYSSSDMDYELQLDDYGRTVWESNSVCSVGYALADVGTVTNEVVSVGDETMSIARTLDGQDRLVGLTIPDPGYEANYAYANDGSIESISNDLACVSYLYSSNRLDVGYSIRLANGTTIQRKLLRDEYRRSLVTNITTVVNGNNVEGFDYSFDAASRPIARNGDTFGYNARNEVVAATISGNSETHEYDDIGNSIRASFNAVTNTFVANNLNQYTTINRNMVPLWETSHDIDGNMTQCGDWTYAYDAGHQLKSVSSNGVLLVTNYYDAKSRRVRKVTPEAATTFFYDDWNLIEERIAYANGNTSTIHYYWGKDLSGTFQAAGGVGGLLYLTVDGTIYIPCYDNIGNVTRYLDANGNTVAQYTYDAFGHTVSKSGPLADFFRHRFSTKYFDIETGLCYYGYRFYHPILMRWFNRDPMEEEGGWNLYSFCANSSTLDIDVLGTTNIGRILDSFLSKSDSGEKLWVMGENDDYTAIVRDWAPVKSEVSTIKSRVAHAPRRWSASHTTSPSWAPQMRYGFDTRSGYVRLVPHPEGTDPATAAKAYIIYIFTTIRTDSLHTSSIGSFNIAATVDTVTFQPCRATINIWMYNEMSRRSFGIFANHWYFRNRSMRSQYMWWNWKERITFNGRGEYHDEP